MRLTRKKRTELCIEAWTIHAKTGCTKSELPWEHQAIYNSCWFCEYGKQQADRHNTDDVCKYCPLEKMFKIGGCYNKNCHYLKWSNAKTTSDRMMVEQMLLGE